MTYTVTQAGPVRVAASLVGEAVTRVFDAICKPGSLSLSKSTVLEHRESLTAGEAGMLVIRQADRWCSATAFLHPKHPPVSCRNLR